MDNLELIKRRAVQIFSEEDLDKKMKSGKKLTIKFTYKHIHVEFLPIIR